MNDILIYIEILFESLKCERGIRQGFCDAAEVFSDDSENKKRLRQAVQYWDASQKQKAFDCIGLGYNCEKLDAMHNFLLLCDNDTHMPSEVLDYIMYDFELWKRRQEYLRFQKKKIQKQNLFVMISSFILCLLSSYVFGLVSVVAYCKRGIMTGSAMFSCTVLVILFLLFGIANKRAKKKEKDNIDNTLPLLSYWLFWSCFSLEERGVYQTLLFSVKRLKEGLLKKELERLIEKVRENPASKEPYEEFLPEVEVPQMRMAIRLLASVNANGYEQTKHEVCYLMREYQRTDEQSKRKYSNFFLVRCQRILQIPFWIVGIKLLWDMITLFRIIGQDYVAFCGG